MTNKLATTRWAFDLSTWSSPTLNQLTQAVAAIQPEERTRLMKFYFINDFLSSLVGRLLMRKYVSEMCNLPYEDIKFARDLRGKPYLLPNEGTKATPALSFNVSHQGNYVILAGVINTNQTDFNDFGIGCDVMKMEYSGGKDLKEFFRIMHRKFANSEWNYICQPHFNQQQQLKAFMRHWCLKESYVKELGVGITVDLQKIAFTVDSNKELNLETQPLCGTTLKCNDLPMTQWYFEEHLLHPKYCAAIAFRNFKPEKTDKFQLLTINELLHTSVQQNDQEIIDYCRTALSKPNK
ncbi:L-aminoadipate-semialdehyde dehydrogenase-phosphopantetheinyl transferase [Lucilia sericata]|uniref:L-aminoadipate-semialdehyde dehydrogenase-phosphopantetheinyl transferase n=1 Tax=Lucilia sericata TaxID=13632 RepID=UPI0018A83EE8|nr:L-aminoadipate-semialdehyde dehydrogenase-phosphopantetheinyl transferase [Lucilia sericata]